LRVVVEEYEARRVVNVYRRLDPWFWTRYSAYPYVGCAHGCTYCYTREAKYSPYQDPADFEQVIRVKVNAAKLMRRELRRLPKDVVGVGDWQPIEKKYRLSRRMLEVCLELGFPVFILEKSDLVVRDLDLLRRMARRGIPVITGFSIITTRDDKVRRLFEPGAPSVKRRFKAMHRFAKAGLLTGTVMMPVLPFIYDDKENLEAVVARTQECGGSYVLVGTLTLASPQREWFYDAVRRYDPGLVEQYQELYDGGNSYNPHPDYWSKLGSMVEELCRQYGLRDRIPRPILEGRVAFNLRVGEILYDRAYRATLRGAGGFKEFALRKAGWLVDRQPVSLLEVWRRDGRDGLRAIHGIGPKLAAEIESAILEVMAQQEGGDGGKSQ